MPDLSQLSDQELADLYKQSFGPAAADISIPVKGPDTSVLATKAQQRLASQRYANKADPTRGIPESQLLLEGIGQGFSDVGRHVGNLVGAIPDERLQTAAEIDAPLRANRTGDVGSFIGSNAALAPITMGATGLLSRMGKPFASALSRPIVRGGFEGGLQGAIQAPPGSKGLGVIQGAAFGTALPAIGNIYKIARSGLKRTPEAQRLLDEGVDLTPGQMNPETAHNQIEQAWQSVPLVGQILQGARENAQRDFQRVAIQKGAAPGVSIKPAEVRDMLTQAYASFEPLYDQAKGFPVYPTIFNAGANKPLSAAFSEAASAKGIRAKDSVRKSVDSWLDDTLSQLPKNPDSADLIALRSDIRTEIRTSKVSGSSEDEAAARLLSRAEDAVTQALESQLPKQALDALKTGDSKYGTYKILENAVARSKDRLGGFSPNDLSEAVFKETPDPIYARGGGGPLRQLASDAKSTISQTEPKTGSRMGPIAAPIMVGATQPHIAIPAALAALGLAGSRSGRRFAAGVTAPQVALQKLDAATIAKLPPFYREIAAELARRGTVSGGLLSAGQ